MEPTESVHTLSILDFTQLKKIKMISKVIKWDILNSIETVLSIVVTMAMHVITKNDLILNSTPENRL